MKKRILIILAVFAITFGFNLMSVSAATKDNCSSTGIRCQGIKIGKGEFSGRSSNEVYVSKGGRIDIGIYTDEDSLFQMGVYLDDENLNLHGSSIATGSGGINRKTIIAPHSGYYHVVIQKFKILLLNYRNLY